MEYIQSTLLNLVQQTAFLNLTFGNMIMIFVAFIFLYLAIKKGFEPLLLVPISFGMLLVNIYPDIMLSIEDSSNGVGGLLHYFYLLDEWSILPSLIFMGVGAMTDFGPLIANPKSFLLGAAAQFGIYAAYFLAIFMGFNDKAAAAISIIGGAGGPPSLFLARQPLPGRQAGTDGIHGPYCRCRLLLHGPGTHHPAADHEASDHRRGEKDQDGAAPSGVQAGEDPVPHHRYCCCVSDLTDDRTVGWYADGRQPVP
ncbi:sodium ion-translocating decarboxylase beta subunit [Clostridium sp. CAG:58]|nr:sodium ion-translocating decarboxylase beta subunit [Clostridium sp. CAG:58]